MSFSPALYYLNAWNRLKILPLVKHFSDLRAPSSTPSNFHSLICLMSLLGVQKNYSGVTNRPLQAKKVVSKGEKEGKFTTNKKTRDWCFHWSRGCCNQLVLRLTGAWLIFVTDGAKDHVAIFLTTLMVYDVLFTSLMTLAWRQRSYHLRPNVVTVKSSNVSPNVITFNTLLHLGWNVITCKILLHLGPVIKLRISTNVTYMNSQDSCFEKYTHVQRV